MDCNFDASLVSGYLPLSDVIHEMNAFTGGSLSRLASTVTEGWEQASPWLFSDALDVIQASAKTLEKLEGRVSYGEGLLELTDLVLRCPQLTTFKVYCDFYSQEVEDLEDQNWRVGSSLEEVQESKLETLAIRIRAGPGKIVINESMIKWVGSSLETLSLLRGLGIDYDEKRENGLPLLNLIQNSRFSLQSLEVLGFSHSNLPVQLVPRSLIILAAVKNLELEGNLD